VPLPKWAKADSGIMLSCAVLTAAPVDAPPLAVLASELAAALRAVSLATAEAVGVLLLVRMVVPATALVDCRPADRAARGADIDILEDFRVLPIFGRDLHHHMILVERVIDRRDQPLAEGVIEGGIDLALRQPKP
jgi:hypothetical protein